LFHKPLVPYSRGKGYHQPGCRIDHFSLPELLTLTASEAPAFIGLQAGTGQLLDPLVVEAVGLLPEADCQPPDRFWGDACEPTRSENGQKRTLRVYGPNEAVLVRPCCTPHRGTFGELQGRIRWISNSDGFALADLAIPHPKSPPLWGVLTFAELALATPAANPSLVTDPVWSVALAGPANPSFPEVSLACLAVTGTLMIDAG